MSCLKTVLLPWSGYMAVDSKGSPREGYEKPYAHKPSECVPDVQVGNLVEVAARIRDNPETRNPGNFYAVACLESKGMIVAVRAHLSTLPCLEILYVITPAGIEFLNSQEAPESWS
jgi:hypothetical protein